MKNRIEELKFTFCLLMLLAICTTTMAQADEMLTEADYKKYVQVELTSPLMDRLQPWERQVLPYLIEAAQHMDDIFWKQSFPGDRDSLLKSARTKTEKDYLTYNYGPWDRLNGNRPFKDGYGAKPLGANFYPLDMKTDEFNAMNELAKESLYTLLRRDEKGKLKTVPYHVAYKKEVDAAVAALRNASELCQEYDLKEYLGLRANALLDDHYEPSDIQWLKMKDNRLDVIIGPIENYEDKLFGYKAANEAYVLIKDKEWSKRLDEIAKHLPELQENLPVAPQYKTEKPGSNAQLAVFDVVYYAGDCNSGSKTIAVNLPNDEQLQLKLGTRRSQLKNVMRAKFDKILVPISENLNCI